MKIGIAMIPNAEMLKSIIEFQQQVMSICPLRPELGTDINLPHITLLQGRFKDGLNWLDIISQLRHYCLEQGYSLEIRLTGWEYKSPGWYFLSLNQNKIFNEAHKFVFSHLKEVMFLSKEDLRKDISKYTSLERYNYLNYGYRFIEEAFHPHITLGKLMDNHLALNETTLNELFQSFLINNVGKLQKITIYEMGENGSHATTLYSVEL